MKKINHFKTAKLATNKPAPKIVGRMITIYPDAMKKDDKIVEFVGSVPTYDDIKAEVTGRPERIHSFKNYWDVNDNGDDIDLKCVCYGHHLGRFVLPLNEQASHIHLGQAGGEFGGCNPDYYALFGPIVVLIGSRAFLNWV